MATTCTVGSFGMLVSEDLQLQPWADFVEPPETDAGQTLENPDYDGGEHARRAQEMFAVLLEDKWLFHPSSEPVAASSVRGTSQGDAPSGERVSGSMGPTRSLAADSSRQRQGQDGQVVAYRNYAGYFDKGGRFAELLADHSIAYEVINTHQFKYLRSPLAKTLVATLLMPTWLKGQDNLTCARLFSYALKEFVVEAHRQLTSSATIMETDWKDEIMNEAQLIMSSLVRNSQVNVVEDLVLCLEAFEVGKTTSANHSYWLTNALKFLIFAALKEAPSHDKTAWQEKMRCRIHEEAGELYGSIDVRAWPQILDLADADCSILDGKACVAQIRLQLCSHSDLHEWTLGLRSAAALINTLKIAEHFDKEHLCEVFNDRVHFPLTTRSELLHAVLKDARRTYIRDVLEFIDLTETDLAERMDDEIQLVMSLVVSLDVDIRWCPHAFFQMKSEWIAGSFRSRNGGVVTCQELSPEQICDHIENGENHEDLLKVAVKELLRSNRKFEAARMLARPLSAHTQVFETNRNDKQLAYIVSLYQEANSVVDRFGPCEEESLTLPCTARSVLYVDDKGKAMNKLEQDLLSQQAPMTVGIWWFWRCFNSQLDKKPRASFVALAYRETFVIVDLDRVEKVTEDVEKLVKNLMCQILGAEHILKVTHDVDSHALSILQRALIPNAIYSSDEALAMQSLSPVLDMSFVLASVKQMQPSSPAVSKLMISVLNYLRMDLCMAESLSNFERRPLRLSQQHYALTIAWCPLMILRVLTTYGILSPTDLLPMVFQLGCAGAPDQWDDILRSSWMIDPQFSNLRPAKGACDAMDPMSDHLDGPYGRNPWTDVDWVNEVPRLEAKFDFRSCLQHSAKEILNALSLPPGRPSQLCREVLSRLNEGTKEDLEKLYEACGSVVLKLPEEPVMGTGGGPTPAFSFDRKCEGFSPLFLAKPVRNTAAVNAGDYRLYVGGGAINRAFGELLKKEQGLQFGKTCEEYSKMHQALLHASRAVGGLVSAVDVPEAAALLEKLHLLASFGRAGRPLQGDTVGLEAATGSIFIDVFESDARPHATGNVAMLYVVGPKGEHCTGPRGKDTGPLLAKSSFLAAVEDLGRNALASVIEYNCCSGAALPPIEEIRWCLVSGGVYCHGEATKLDVAKATLQGMMSVQDAHNIGVSFAYDDDVFLCAYNGEAAA